MSIAWNMVDAVFFHPGVILACIVVAITYCIWKVGLFNRLLYKLDVSSTQNGGDIVGKVLKAHGVKFIFTLCGGHISPILVSAEKLKIRVVDVRNEASAVFAADAVARCSGVIGVAAVTAGPGLTNTVTAIKNAQMAESPVLLLGGAAAGLLKGRGALQDIDQMVLFKPLCKYCATVKRIRDIPRILRHAIQVAQSGTPGPVFVEFPIDTLYPYHIVCKEIGFKDQAQASWGQWFTTLYIKNYLFNLFAGAFESLNDPHADLSPLPVNIPSCGASQVNQAMQLILNAQRPVFVLGSQATLPPIPATQLAEALKKLGIPCFLGGMSRGLLGRDSSIQFKQQRREALREADVVILAGTVCDFRLSYGRGFSRKTKIIAINRDHQQLYKNSDMFWKPTVAIEADVASTVIHIIDQLFITQPDYACPSTWLKTLDNRDRQKEEANVSMSSAPTEMHLNPLKILENLEKFMDPKNTILVCDGGDFVGSAAYILKPRGPLTWLDPGAFGTLGVGGGFALGAKLCRPECDVWIIFGDGACGYSVAEFDTYNRHKCPVIAVVGNDACWSQIAREQKPMFGSNIGCDLAFCDYNVVAEGFGGKGFQLDRSNESQMMELFKKAKDASADKPVLINCLIGKTKFREGSISV